MNCAVTITRSLLVKLMCTWLSRCVSDVDECALTTHDCQARQTCANTEGSFTCLGPVAPPNGQLTPGIEEDCEIGYAYNRVTERCEGKSHTNTHTANR